MKKTRMGSTPRPDAQPAAQSAADRKSRRSFLVSAGGGVLGLAAAGVAGAESLVDVPQRQLGAPLSERSERSEFVKLGRIPESTPGKRNVDPLDAINSKTPLQNLYGVITPSDLHYERSHSGIPSLDPALHRVLLHGMTRKQLVLTVDDLKSMPSTSRIAFLECSGNGWENWQQADPALTAQDLYGMVSTHEWTGVPLAYLVSLVGKSADSSWMLAEGGDASGMARSIPLTDEILSEAIVAYAQNGEPLRPAHGYPLRLLIPGFEGNMSVKWLRRLKFGDKPFMTRWETARYTSLMPDGRARQFHLRQDVNSLITAPSGMMAIKPGYHRISGLAWSGHGSISRVEVSVDGGGTWRDAQLNAPVLPKAQVRFQADWTWDGAATKIVSRSTDEKGHVQPTREALIGALGTNAVFHFNAQQTWSVDAQGAVRNVLA
jgi:sulfane dehydrogenase subunit SoxC